MKTIENVIYVPVIAESTEKAKWDPFLTNDAVDNSFFKGDSVLMSEGVNCFTREYSEQGALDSVRGELASLISLDETSEPTVDSETSVEGEIEAVGAGEGFGSETDTGGLDSGDSDPGEGFDGD